MYQFSNLGFKTHVQKDVDSNLWLVNIIVDFHLAILPMNPHPQMSLYKIYNFMQQLHVSYTTNCGILYKTAMPIRLEWYTDADWASYKADRRSTFGFVFSLDNGAIS